eukprot:Hpha_TRINITY_DN3713_c0_g2::TRINITY_DN3713_c0_g2_i1::g.23840::m.23840
MEEGVVSGRCVEHVVELLLKRGVQLERLAGGAGFVTQERLHQEAVGAIRERGRCEVQDLCRDLGLRQATARICLLAAAAEAGAKPHLTAGGGDVVLTDACLERTFADLEAVLSERGSLSLAEAFERANLCTAVVEPRLRAVAAGMCDGLAYTQHFADAEAARVSEFLAQAEEPVQLEAVARAVKLALPSLLLQVVEGDIAAGRLEGKVHGGKVYNPAVFERRKEESAREHFREMGALSFAWLKGQGVPNPASWVADTLGAQEHVRLPSSAVSPVVLSSALSAIEQLARCDLLGMNEPRALNIVGMLPQELEPGDVDELAGGWFSDALRELHSVTRHAHTWWAAEGALEEAVERARTAAPKEVQRLQKARLQSGQLVLPQVQTPEPKTKRKRPGKKGAKVACVDEADEAEADDGLFDRGFLTVCIKGAFHVPPSEPGAEALYESLLRELARRVRPAYEQEWELARDACAREGKMRGSLEGNVQQLWQELVIESRSTLRVDSSGVFSAEDVRRMSRGIVDTLGMSFLCLTTQLTAVQAGSPDAPPVPPDELERALAQLLESHRRPIQSLLDVVKEDSSDPAGELAKAALRDAGMLGLVLRQPKAKEEKEMRAKHAEDLRKY